MQKDLTKGSIFRNLAVFSLPFFLSYFLQTLYGLADLFIIGQFNGSDSITAVSIGSQIMHMLTVIIVGLAMGTTVMISRFVGAKKEKEVSQAIGNSITLFAIVAVVLCVVLIAAVAPIVSIMSTPMEAAEQTRSYLLICFAGIPFIIAYNMISAIFRGLGDSKSPMYFVAVACVVNIVLDYVLIGVFDMRAAGAALGTVISQTISVLFALVSIIKGKNHLSLKRRNLIPDKQMMGNIMKIGLPVSLQDGFVQVSFIIITIIANMRGVEIAAAVGIVEKIISMLFLVPSSMLSAVSALAAQNMGAGKNDRATKTLQYGIGITVIFGVLCSLVIQFIAKPLIGSFTNDTAVVLFGVQYLKTYVFDCIFAGIHFCFSGYFCAYGKSMYSFIHNVAAIILVRIPGAYLASVYYPDTLSPMGCAAPAGSLFSALICVGLFAYMRKKR
ncbi:MAG: MATE family efflux transporter [Hespellia sp.]|nr:MATE family efflux transporter [Hespellia sp.]